MSDLDDLMSHLSAYDDPDQTAPADAIAANQAAKMSGKFLSWGKRGPTKEEREAKSPQLSRVVETVVGKEKTNMNTNNTKDETMLVEKAHQTVAVSEVREKSASPVKARVATVATVRATEAKKVEVSKTTSAKAKQPPPPPLGPSEKASF